MLKLSKVLPVVPSIFTVGQFSKRNKAHTAIVMGNAGNMTLHQVLKISDIKDFGDIELLSCIEQIAALLEALQARFRFMHRDLKDDNVMVRKTQGGYQVLLIDFGFSRGEFPVGSRRVTLENADLLDGLELTPSCGFDHVGSTYDRSTDLLMLMTRIFRTIKDYSGKRRFSARIYTFLGRKATLFPFYFDSQRHAKMNPDEIQQGIAYGVFKDSSRQGAIEMSSDAKQRVLTCMSRGFAARPTINHFSVLNHVMYQASGVDIPAFYPMYVKREVHMLAGRAA
jgi:serine/threonine protein kinase